MAGTGMDDTNEANAAADSTILPETAAPTNTVKTVESTLERFDELAELIELAAQATQAPSESERQEILVLAEILRHRAASMNRMSKEMGSETAALLQASKRLLEKVARATRAAEQFTETDERSSDRSQIGKTHDDQR